MLDNRGFDEWAGDYDESIVKSSKGYPFEGYYDVLAFVQSLIEEPNGKRILDVGIGTGLLTNELYKQGSIIFGLDFSQKMIIEAMNKMPKGSFYIFDMTDGIPEELKNNKFDYIVSSYAIHHLSNVEKIRFVKTLKDILVEDGLIIIADISFKKKDDLINCKDESGHEWDDDEEYMVIDELMDDLFKLGFSIRYTQISKYAGALELREIR